MVQPKDVPAYTGLAQYKFQRPKTKHSEPYITPDDAGSSWQKPGPVSGPFHAQLGDGSVVTYSWYRFADQPALLNADLTDSECESMQKRERKTSSQLENGPRISSATHGRQRGPYRLRFACYTPAWLRGGICAHRHPPVRQGVRWPWWGRGREKVRISLGKGAISRLCPQSNEYGFVGEIGVYQIPITTVGFPILGDEVR